MIRSLKEKLTETISEAFKTCGYDMKFGLVVESQRPDLGQFQCNGALGAAKEAKKNPRQVAQEVVSICEQNQMFKTVSIAGPGFINISLNDAFIAEHINTVASDHRFGIPIAKESKNIVIDFGSPNVAKPMHVGHLRSAIIGDSLQKILKYLGHMVIADNHVGDWGTQMGMLIVELKSRKPDLVYFEESCEGPYPEEPPVTLEELETMYPEASRKCKENESMMAAALSATDELQKGRPGYVALWKHFVTLSTASLKNDFKALGVEFDYWHGESFYKDRMEKITQQLKEQGNAVESEGALVIPVADENESIPPVMLVKSGGGFLYTTSDIATIDYRLEALKADVMLYVVDKRQYFHFEQVFRAVRKTGIAKPDTVLEHVGFGTVNGPDGKPFKTREGGVMKLNELIEQVTQKADLRMNEAGIARDLTAEEHQDIAKKVGIAALKFADLVNHRTTDYVFDIDKFCRFEGKTGPYLLYTAVRIKSILRKAQENALSPANILPPTDKERTLMLLLAQLPDTIKSAQEGYAPNYLCDFAYNLAQEFNRFYKECHILREDDEERQASWLALSILCLRELEIVLRLTGMEIPEKM